MTESDARAKSRVPGWAMLVWVAAIVGVALWILRPAEDYVPPPGWRHWPQTGPVLAIAEEEAGRLLTAGPAGLFLLDPGENNPAPRAASGFRAPGVVHALARDPAGRLWIGHQGGITIRDGERWIAVERLGDRPLTDVRAIAFDRDAAAWIGAGGGVWRVRPPGQGPVPASDLAAEPVLSGVETLTMLIDRDGGIWIGSRNGLHHRDETGHPGWRHWTTADGLPNQQVAALMQDRAGRIWTGTGFHDRGGTILLERRSGAWRIAATLDPASLAAPKSRSLFETGAGDVWIGSETDGFSILGPDLRARAIVAGRRLPNPEVTVIRADGKGGLWLGTLGGLIHVDAGAAGRLID